MHLWCASPQKQCCLEGPLCAGLVTTSSRAPSHLILTALFYLQVGGGGGGGEKCHSLSNVTEL